MCTDLRRQGTVDDTWHTAEGESAEPPPFHLKPTAGGEETEVRDAPGH